MERPQLFPKIALRIKTGTFQITALLSMRMLTSTYITKALKSFTEKRTCTSTKNQGLWRNDVAENSSNLNSQSIYGSY